LENDSKWLEKSIETDKKQASESCAVFETQQAEGKENWNCCE